MTFTIKSPTNNFKSIRPGEPLFAFTDDFVYVPRAGIEVDPKCPSRYIDIVNQCIMNNWIRPVAFMRDDEYIWEKLKE